MIWTIFKQSILDFWDEMLYLVLFNVIWLVGALLVIPLPFVTFALFFIVRDVGEGKGIKFGHFFAYGRRMWKPAYIWGGINLGVLVLLWLNLNFYAGIEARWAALMQLLMTTITIFWVALQVIALAFYPRLTEPSFKLALRNATVITGRYPLIIIAVLIANVLILVISSIFPAFAFAISFSLIAVLTNRTVDTLVSREMARLEEEK